MKITKSQISNLVFLILVAVLLFTPIGTQIKVFITRLIATSPTVNTISKSEQLTNYDWDLRNLEGEQLSFSSLKNKVVLVNFWATWCPPCIAEMPSLQNLYADYKEEVVFLFVSNEDTAVLEKFMEKHSYNFPVFNVFSEVPKQLVSKSIPATFLISKDGTIVIDEKGAAKWDSEEVRNTIDDLLGN
ncbi:TlpA family protein disulfide reductase [Joostella sp. CR20]|uniref:TlpA family protein disulfide reductase n=1 Tax=Joostella sp. CR20 TaxID=2804312 RepID=UPI00313BFB2D